MLAWSSGVGAHRRRANHFACASRWLAGLLLHLSRQFSLLILTTPGLNTHRPATDGSNCTGEKNTWWFWGAPRTSTLVEIRTKEKVIVERHGHGVPKLVRDESDVAFAASGCVARTLLGLNGYDDLVAAQVASSGRRQSSARLLQGSHP